MFSAGSLVAATAANKYVTVTAVKKNANDFGDILGVVPVAPGDFHIATRNVLNGFQAEVTVVANSPYEFAPGETTKTFTMSVGGIADWSVKNPEQVEDGGKGEIILFKVDVEIGGVAGEEKRTKGTFIDYDPCTHAPTEVCEKCHSCLKSVVIKCLPDNRPDDEEINPASAYGILLEEDDCGNYRIAAKSYKANEIANKSFVLRSRKVSTGIPDCTIVATHNPSGSRDVAGYTTTKYSFSAYSIAPVTQNGEFVAAVQKGITRAFDHGHSSWRIGVEPSALLTPEAGVFSPSDLLNKAFANQPMGFSGRGLVGGVRYDFSNKAFYFADISGVIEPDGARGYNYTWIRTLSQVKSALAATAGLSASPPDYNAQTRNCAHVVVEVAGAAGVTLDVDSASVYVKTITLLRTPIKVNQTFTFEVSPGLLAKELKKLSNGGQ